MFWKSWSFPKKVKASWSESFSFLSACCIYVRISLFSLILTILPALALLLPCLPIKFHRFLQPLLSLLFLSELWDLELELCEYGQTDTDTKWKEPKWESNQCPSPHPQHHITPHKERAWLASTSTSTFYLVVSVQREKLRESSTVHKNNSFSTNIIFTPSSSCTDCMCTCTTNSGYRAIPHIMVSLREQSVK